MNGYSRNVLDQNITRSVLGKSREEIISKYRNSATNIRSELEDINKEQAKLINKKIYVKLRDFSLIKTLRNISKVNIFEQNWLDISFIETKNTEIINKILDEWEKKQSSQRRDLNELFKFLKSQDLSANYQRVIEANRTSKYINYEEVRFMYSHPSIEISGSMEYILTRNEYYFYKNFELLLILSTSFQKNEDVRNNEISNMRNLSGSLYYKLLSYSKKMNHIMELLKDNSISSKDGRFKHSLILEQLKSENEDQKNIENYEILNLNETKTVLKSLTFTLERINCILGVNVQKELFHYQQIKDCIITKEK